MYSVSDCLKSVKLHCNYYDLWVPNECAKRTAYKNYAYKHESHIFFSSDQYTYYIYLYSNGILFRAKLHSPNPFVLNSRKTVMTQNILK